MRTLLWLLAIGLPLNGLAYTPDLSTLSSVPRLQLDAAQVQTALNSLNDDARHYAVAQSVDAGTESGNWTQGSDGLWHWRLRVASTDAVSLAARIDALQLPEGAELWFYTSKGEDLQGPYGRSDNGELWTALVRSEEAVLDARMPDSARAAFAVHLAQVFHGYRSFSEAYPAKSAFGTSGACTVDVACPAGDGWRDEIRSTVLLTIGGTTLCSGNLINNTAQDNRALVLTANHCGLNALNVASSRAYFNVQKSACASGSEGSVKQNIAGRRLLASSASGTRSDYSLFELRSVPPGSYQVFYAGWDVSGVAPSSGVGISHPAGDDKKIAVFDSGAQAVSDLCVGSLVGNTCTGFSIDAWAVRWTLGDTEGGSSGSGLWSQNHRIVGTLTTGNSACMGSVNNNGGTDYYARLDRAWTALSSTGSTLKQVLDANGSGCTNLAGRDAASNSSACASSATTASSSGASAAATSGGGGSAGGLLPLLGLLLLRRRRMN